MSDDSMTDDISELVDDQNSVRRNFITQISKDYPKIGQSLKEIFIICTNSNRQSRIDVYNKILNDFPFGSVEREKLTEYYAKIMDLERRIRKFTNARFYNEKIDNPRSTATADRFHYVFSRMEQENVECEKVKEFFVQNAYAIFSLTMHPTNPTSMDYTIKGGIQFDQYLENNMGYRQHLKLIQTLPLAGRKKTVAEEVEETIAILDIIYYTTPKVRQKLIEALEQFPNYKNIIDVNTPLIQASIWPAGDGDGNENADIKALQNAVVQLKQHIKQLYLKDIKQLASEKTKDIEQKLNDNKYKSPSELINDLQNIPNTEELIYQIKTFAFHYAQIDIRHNALDVMETLTHLLQVNNISDNFSSLSLKDQKNLINEWLSDDKIISQLMSTDDEKLNASSKTAARIFGRLKLIKNDLDIFNKLIIAETTSIVNVLACLLLLKAAGNIVGEKETIIDIVTLSESVKDLEELPNLISELIDDPIYRKHLACRQKLIPMIAKSDTVRRNGRGAESSQEQALGKLYAMVDDIKSKYPELKNLTINGFSGGGAALQRGGGRVTEVPHNNGRVARYFGAKTLGPSLLTLQGHQMQILFSPSSIALHTLESLVAQNLHARAQTELKANGEHYVQPRRAPEGFNERENIGKFFKACQRMREAYFNYMGDLDDESDKDSGNHNFNQLFANAPWASVVLGNLSSRPSKRGGGGTNTDNITVRSLRGDNPKLLNNRAITVERISAHSGTHFLTYLSVFEGLNNLTCEELHSMYLCSKSCRDFMRNTALSLHMTDFDLAWQTMIGQKRPDHNQIVSLAKKFIPNKNGKNSNEEILAWLEIYAYDVAKLVYKSFLNKEPTDDFTLQSPLRSGFNSLAQQLTLREEADEFGRYVEADMTNAMNHDLDMVLNTQKCLTLQSAYAAADVVNAPEGGLNIELTRKQPV
jgi:phosphoenolpyruvate carboxylase